MSEPYDVIVVGVGGMGSSACYHLARRGLRVLGIERHDIPHAFGSSHGQTRIIRLAYAEHPGYVPLLRRAYELWREMGELADERLLYTTGGIDADYEGCDLFTGSLASCIAHGIRHEVLDGAEVNRRFPGYNLPDAHACIFQPDAGFVLPERAIVAHVMAAQRLGARIHARETVLGWESLPGGGVRVTTDRKSYEAGRIVLSPGAWLGSLVPSLAPLAVPERQVLGWFQPALPELFVPERFPVANVSFDEGHYYLLPTWGVPGVKIGRYHHEYEQVDPDTIDRVPSLNDEAILLLCLFHYFPKAVGPVMALTTCMFTNTPDEHFIIDALPEMPEALIVSACSGHGFKFMPVVGEIVADLVATGRSRFDLSMFALDRF